jgi:Rps23 Pro-64 3,4-dihydroxylase Tpa1-like proline 4-hydroxylase
MMNAISLRLASVEVFDKPYPYFTATEVFGKAASASLLGWLETEPRWALTKADFYEQYEFSLADVQPPAHLAFLTDPQFQSDLRVQLEGIFRTRLDERIECTIHKLVPGQRIRIHNDFIPGAETHRLIVQLNRGWSEDQGGLLMLFNSDNPSDIHRVLVPAHDTAMGFAISESSHHAVSTTYAGTRFTVVFSFYARGED